MRSLSGHRTARRGEGDAVIDWSEGREADALEGSLSMSKNRLGKTGYGAFVMDLAETILQRYGIKWPLRSSHENGPNSATVTQDPTVTHDQRQAGSDRTEMSERFNDALRTQAHCPDILHYPCGPKDSSGEPDES